MSHSLYANNVTVTCSVFCQSTFLCLTTSASLEKWKGKLQLVVVPKDHMHEHYEKVFEQFRSIKIDAMGICFAV